MAWETRNGWSYYYRKKRVGNKVVSEYVGRSEVATIISQFDELEVERREIDRILEKRERERFLEAETALREFGRDAEALLTEAMVEAGYHKHKGQWRKRRK